MTDIQQMELAWRLHRDLEIDLAAVDIVLRMRLQIIDLQSEVESLHRQAEERERLLLEKIRELKRESSSL